MNITKQHCWREKFDDLVKRAGICDKETVIKFAEQYNNELNAIIIFLEKEVSSNASFELFNLAMITGKLRKTSNGLISLKEKNNSQGLFDMGIDTRFGVGGIPLTETQNHG